MSIRFGLRRPGFGSPSTRKGGGGTSYPIEAPTVDLVTPTTNPPSFVLGLPVNAGVYGSRIVLEGDVPQYRIDGGSPVDCSALSAADIIAGTATVVNGALSAGSYNMQFRFKRPGTPDLFSDWSAAEPFTITTVPAAFTIGMWSVANLATNGDARVTVSSLPTNGGSAITDIKYRLNGGSWVSSGTTTTGTFDVAGFTDGASTTVELQAVNAVGGSADSDDKSVTTTGVPSAFTVGMWSVADLATGGSLRVTLASLPSNGGSALTRIDYRLDGGSWVDCGRTTTGTFDIGSLSNGHSYTVELRAVNAVGAGTDSDDKTATPTSAAPALLSGMTLGTSNAGGSATFTLSHTTVAGTDLLVVTIEWTHTGGVIGITSVTFDGNAMTLARNANSSQANAVQYYLAAPAIKTANVVVTLASAPDRHYAVQAFNVDNASQVDTSGQQAGTASSGTLTLNLTTSVPTLVIANLNATAGPLVNTTTETNLTEDFDQNPSGSTNRIAVGGHAAEAAAVTTKAYAFVNASNWPVNAIMCAVAYK